jgi:hypothetical protein
MTRLVLVNAVYFSAEWLQPFNTENTKVGKFHVSRNKEVDVPMMHMKAFLGYKHVVSSGVRILELPYQVHSLCRDECSTELIPYSKLVLLVCYVVRFKISTCLVMCNVVQQ